LKHNLEKV